MSWHRSVNLHLAQTSTPRSGPRSRTSSARISCRATPPSWCDCRRRARAQTRVLSASDGRALLRANRDDHLFAGLVLLLLLGLRRSELLGLRWVDVDLEAGLIRVHQGLHRLDHELRFLEPKTALRT
jgi:integrase